VTHLLKTSHKSEIRFQDIEQNHMKGIFSNWYITKNVRP